MRWTPLGHAMWLVEAGGLRLLFDPLLADHHHDGVFTVTPPRRIAVEALRPDVVIVTHRHPDHFDLESLTRLADRWPEAVVLTADTLVGRSCQRMGFRHVSLLPARHRVALDGLQLWTSPSFCEVAEWGMVLVTPDGSAWNQVDTALGDPGRVRAVLAEAAEATGTPALARGPDLGILRWQPMLQVEPMLGGAHAFPHAAWSAELARIVASGSRTALLGAAGGAHRAPEAWLDGWTHPVTEARAIRDLGALAPEMRVVGLELGGAWRIDGGEVGWEADGGRGLVEVTGPGADRRFYPRGLPAVADPDPKGRGEAALLAIVTPWVRGPLVEAVGPALARAGVRRARLLLDVITPTGRAPWSIEVVDGVARAHPGEPEDPDMINTIAASDLADVVLGEAHWGRPLLAGRLRAMDRLYVIEGGRLVRPRLPPFFLYLALSYDRATEIWVDRVLRARDTPSGGGSPWR